MPFPTLLDRNMPIYIYCLFEELFSLIRELGFKNLCPLCIDEPVSIGSFEVIPRKASDADVDSMFQIKAAGLNVLNVVDYLIHEVTIEEVVTRGPWDLVLWPFQTMLETDVIAPSRASVTSGEVPQEFVDQLKKLNPRFVVPSSCQFIIESWSWYNRAMFPITYRQFQRQVEAALPQSKVVRLNPSVSVLLDKTSLQKTSPLPWILPVGEQEVDYEYQADLKAPPTAEISQNFVPLTAEQTQRVYDYCCLGLKEKYQSMEPPDDPYFNKPRLWSLSLYDHTGQATDFLYSLCRGKITLVTESSEEVSWVTEVPICKVYAALELGESLTSMYVRIFDLGLSFSKRQGMRGNLRF